MKLLKFKIESKQNWISNRTYYKSYVQNFAQDHDEAFEIRKPFHEAPVLINNTRIGRGLSFILFKDALVPKVRKLLKLETS